MLSFICGTQRYKARIWKVSKESKFLSFDDRNAVTTLQVEEEEDEE